MTILICKVFSINAITNTVYRILLKPEAPFYFRAGQYLVIINKNNKYFFSLASSPLETTYIELNIGISKNMLYTINILNIFIENCKISVDIPQGKAWLRDDTDRPIILIAGGIGYTYARSILLTVLTNQPKRKIIIYWGGRELNDLYDLDNLNLLALKHSTLSFIPIIKKPDDNWKGRIGTILTAIMQDYNSLESYDIYISGCPKKAQIARKCFCIYKHAVAERIFSDSFF